MTSIERVTEVLNSVESGATEHEYRAWLAWSPAPLVRAKGRTEFGRMVEFFRATGKPGSRILERIALIDCNDPLWTAVQTQTVEWLAGMHGRSGRLLDADSLEVYELASFPLELTRTVG